MTFASNLLWSCYRHHLVRQLNRPCRLLISREDSCRCLTSRLQSIKESLLISLRQSADVLRHYYFPISMPYNMATTDTSIDRVEFSYITAPCVSSLSHLRIRYVNCTGIISIEAPRPHICLLNKIII